MKITSDQAVHPRLSARKPDKTPAPGTSGRNGSFEVTVLSAVVAAVLAIGWWQSGERHLTAEDGVGYYLASRDRSSC